MQPIIVGREGNQRMPLKDVAGVSKKHCIITDNLDGTFTLEDKSRFGTFINGIQVVQAQITPETVLQLGPQFKVKVADLLPKLPPAPAPEFSLKPLRAVWDEYQNRLDAITEKQRRISNLRAASPMFTMGSGAITTIAKLLEWSDSVVYISAGLTVVGLCIMAYAFLQNLNYNSAEEQKKLRDEYLGKYKCPNPKCGRPFPFQPYDVIEFTPGCPSCKCKYTH